MICQHCQHERFIDDDMNTSPLICPNCKMPYAKKATSPEVMAKLRAELATKSKQKRNSQHKPRKSGALKKLITFVEWMVVLIFVALLLRCSSSSDNPSKKDFTWNDALTMCQMTITKLSRDPDTADVPYVPNAGGGNEYYFAWGASTKYARMRNGLGLEVPVSASCIVDGNTRTITSLTFNGKTII